MPPFLTGNRPVEQVGGTTPREKTAIAAIIAGATVAIAGAVFYTRARRQKVNSMSGGLGRVKGRTSVGGMSLTHHYDPKMPIKQRVGILQDLIWKGVNNPQMRHLALAITGDGERDVAVGSKVLKVKGAGCPARDGLCESEAIDRWVRRNIRYTGDVAPVKMGANGPVEGVDLFQGAWRTVEFGGGDCVPASSLVLRDDYQFVPIVDLNPGDRIMSERSWTTVQDRWLTGEKALLAFDLSNGCTLRCTPEHRIFRVVDGRTEEIRAEEAHIGDDLVVADAVPLADNEVLTWPAPFDQLTVEERAWLLGVYIADGWYETHVREGVKKPYRFAISGRDGKPKEAQKHRVQQLIERIGLHAEWNERYLRVNHTAGAEFISAAGSYASTKHVPSLALSSRESVINLLNGLAADSGQEGRNNAFRVYGTTSADLALQLRVLHRMIGQGVHIRRVDDHGGLGENPIYRVTVRENPQRLDTRYARIRAIRDGGTELCADITTDCGKFWLPESDTIVHNCDDHSVVNATLLVLNGIPAKLRITAPRKSSEWAHIYTMAGVPKTGPRKFVALDTTLPGNMFAREAPFGRKIDFIA